MCFWLIAILSLAVWKQIVEEKKRKTKAKEKELTDLKEAIATLKECERMRDTSQT